MIRKIYLVIREAVYEDDVYLFQQLHDSVDEAKGYIQHTIDLEADDPQNVSWEDYNQFECSARRGCIAKGITPYDVFTIYERELTV